MDSLRGSGRCYRRESVGVHFNGLDELHGLDVRKMEVRKKRHPDLWKISGGHSKNRASSPSSLLKSSYFEQEALSVHFIGLDKLDKLDGLDIRKMDREKRHPNLENSGGHSKKNRASSPSSLSSRSFFEQEALSVHFIGLDKLDELDGLDVRNRPGKATSGPLENFRRALQKPSVKSVKFVKSFIFRAGGSERPLYRLDKLDELDGKISSGHSKNRASSPSSLSSRSYFEQEALSVHFIGLDKLDGLDGLDARTVSFIQRLSGRRQHEPLRT